MRILLDEHVSGRIVGEGLRVTGHDVLALDQAPSLREMPDEQVLEMALTDRRILVTFNVKHFARLTRLSLADGRSHWGCIWVVDIPHHDFGRLLRGLRQYLEDRPDPVHWENAIRILSPSQLR